MKDFFEKTIFSSIDILNQLNPLNIFYQKPIEEFKVNFVENYKVFLNLTYINQLIFIEIVQDTDYLDSMIFSADKGKLYLRGSYNVANYPLIRITGVKVIDYYVELTPIRISGNKVRLRITNYFLKNHEHKKYDFVYYLSKIDPIHKRLILNSIIEEAPKVLSLTRLKYEIRMDLNYFLNKIPQLSSNIDIEKVFCDNNTVIFYVKSNTLIMSLVEFFGPDYVRIEPI